MNQRVLVMGSIFLTSFGGILALLGSTTISTQAGAEIGAGAMFTGVLLAVKFAPSVIAMPYATWFAARLGTKRAFVSGQVAMIALNLLLAVVLLAGAPAYVTLLVFSLLLGAIGAMLHVLVPVVMKSFLPSTSMAGSLSMAAVANGLAAVTGALASTVLLAMVDPAFTFVVNGVLTIPYVLVLLFVKPAKPIGSPTRSKRTWQTLIVTVRSNHRLRRACIIGFIGYLLIGPLSQMVVPVTQDLQISLTSNAGYLLAVIALGQMASPYSVRAIGRRFSALYGGTLAVAIGGVALCTFAGFVWFADARWLMYTGIAIAALVYGSMRTSAENLLVDDAATASADGETSQVNITAFEFMVSFAAPIGPLLWGIAMDGLSATATLAIVGVLAVAFAAISATTARGQGASNTPLSAG